MGQAHTDLINDILLLLSIPGVRVWQNQTGVARSMDGKRIITFGMKGSADILGVIKCKSGVGAILGIECKIGDDDLKKQQIFFKKMIDSHGGLYLQAHNTYTGILDSVLNFMQSH